MSKLWSMLLKQHQYLFPLIFIQIIYFHFINCKFPSKLILCLHIMLLLFHFTSKSPWPHTLTWDLNEHFFLCDLETFISGPTVHHKLQTSMCKWLLAISTLGHLNCDMFTPELRFSPSLFLLLSKFIIYPSVPARSMGPISQVTFTRKHITMVGGNHHTHFTCHTLFSAQEGFWPHHWSWNRTSVCHPPLCWRIQWSFSCSHRAVPPGHIWCSHSLLSLSSWFVWCHPFLDFLFSYWSFVLRLFLWAFCVGL